MRIESVSPIVVSYSCGDIDPTITAGDVVFARTGDLIEGLAVTFEITGSTLTSPSSISFQPSERTASITVGSGSLVPRGEIVVTLLDEGGYNLGQPATATVLVDD